MNKGSVLLMLISAGFALLCCTLLVCDIMKAAYHQFKGDGYEWYTIRVLKEKREWWKWALAIATFALGTYWLLPASWVGQADARAFRQRPEYTAYYACKYEIEHYGDGVGFAELIKKDGSFTVSRLFTDEGFIDINYELDSDDEFDSSIWLTFCTEDDSSIRLTGDPVSKEIASAGRETEVFGYPDATKEYCLACRVCGAGYYTGCGNGSEWMCPECTDNCETYCHICDEPCPLWRGGKDEYVICEHCLRNWFRDTDLRYYFGTGEWPEE